MIYNSEENRKAEEEFWMAAESDMLFGTNNIPETVVSNKVFAKILVDGEDTLAYMDQKTMKAYEIGEGYEETDKEIKDFTFVRWGRPMDV